MTEQQPEQTEPTVVVEEAENVNVAQDANPGPDAGDVEQNQDDEEDVDAVYAAAQERDEDPDGDEDALDVDAAEEPSDTDPEPQLNEDADDPLTDVEQGEDLGDDWDSDGDGTPDSEEATDGS